MESEYYEKAKKKVDEKKKFHRHLQSYIITNLIMVFTGAFWGGWKIAAMFWGIGLFSHFVKAYGFMGLSDDDPEWEEREIEKEVRRMKAKKANRSTSPPSYRKAEDDFDVDTHLDLNEPRPMPRKKYDEEDLV